MRTRAARLYVSPRTRPLTAEEQEVRRIAYALKVAEPAAVEVAARELARLIDGPCWLVPVPTSRGSIACASFVPSAPSIKSFCISTTTITLRIATAPFKESTMDLQSKYNGS